MAEASRAGGCDDDFRNRYGFATQLATQTARRRPFWHSADLLEAFVLLDPARS
jgi:hypothetical protein